MTLSFSAFFLSALVLFAAFLASFTAVMQGRLREQRRRRRFGDILGAHAPRSGTETLAPIVVTRRDAELVTLGERLASVFGWSPARAHVSPLSFRPALGLTLAFSFAVAWFATVLLGHAGWFLVLPLWPVSSRFLFAFFEHRRVRTLFRQFPDALSMIVRGVRVGIPVSDSIRAVAVESAAPTSSEFALLADELTIGVSLEDALRALASRNNLQEYRFFATAIALQHQTGGRLSETLENLAEIIRKRVAVRARGYALAAEARMSAMVLAALPFIAFGALLVLSPNYVMFFFNDRTGHLMLAGALGDITAGMLIMRLMIVKSLS